MPAGIRCASTTSVFPSRVKFRSGCAVPNGTFCTVALCPPAGRCGFTLFTANHKWTQEVRSGSSYLSSSDLCLHFGLGKAAAYDRIQVEWPSGLHEQFPAGPADRILPLVEGTGTVLH